MLSGFYDLIENPDGYRAIWRAGEIYIEPATAPVDGSDTERPTPSEETIQ